MRVRWRIGQDTFTCGLRLDPEDQLTGTGQAGRQVRLLTNHFRVQLPTVITEPHPDLLAAAAWSAVAPWTARRLTVDRPISHQLAQTFARAHDIEVGPVDDGLAPRSPGVLPGLSYSGGADSVAVAEVLPPATPHIHFRRVPHPRVPDRATPIRAAQVEELVLEAGRRGRDVHVVRSDLEYLCLPQPTFPHWTAVGIGITLMADHLDLGAAAYGTVLGTKYLQSGLRFRPEASGNTRDAQVGAAVGLAQLRPACGMSEVVTVGLAHRSVLGDLVRSCLIGDGGPCLACTKCFRKELVLSVLDERPPNPLLWERTSPPTSPVFREYQNGPPWHMQHVLEYGLTRAHGIARSPAGWMLQRISSTPDQTGWLTRYYPPALQHEVPPAFRQSVSEAVDELVGFMTPDDVVAMETYDATRSRADSGVPR